MDNINIENLLDPISVKVFFKDYWRKKHLVIRRNKYKGLYTWDDFNTYMNRFPANKSLQILDYDGKDGKWCLDKMRKGQLKLPKLSKQDVFNLWKKGKTFVIPFLEYEKKELVDICFEFEKYFGRGQANVYASPGANSKSYPAHGDATENFLFHTEGKTNWTLYKEFKPDQPKTVLEKVTLEPGDLLYIPKGQYHEVTTSEPRILISIHFTNKEGQSLEKFKITSVNDNKRDKWYDWKPFIKNNKPVTIERLMNKKNWSKPYFNRSK
jgi:bifunctional lysine-specific demethylase and histidyl-hydroxylase MINA